MDEKLDFSILFVEDEEKMRKNYVQYLKRYYKNVYEADNGKIGYDIYIDKKPDILIVDINLPIMNGLEMLSKIRKKDHTTKAVMLTAHSDKDFLLEAAELKLTKYLLKPISRMELKETLEKAIDEIKKFQTTSNHIIVMPDKYTWNQTTMELYKNQKIVELTNKEKKVFELLILNTNKTLSYDDIIIYVWDSFEVDKMNALKLIIKKLRKKLPENFIKNVYGEGIKITL